MEHLQLMHYSTSCVGAAVDPCDRATRVKRPHWCQLYRWRAKAEDVAADGLYAY